FEALQRDAAGKVIQRGGCTLPNGRVLSLTVNDEAGGSTPGGDVRVFAGLRLDPFFLSLAAVGVQRGSKLLPHDNGLCIVVDFDTRRLLDPTKGSLFGVIAETVPIPQPGGLVAHPVARIDWVGRPEQTNIRLSNPALLAADDLRDLWNQQTPFAI